MKSPTKPDTLKEEAISPNAPARVEYPRTVSGVEIKEIYRPEDVKGFDYDRDLGEPGAFPYTRGVQRDMYRGRFWTMRQFSGFGTARDTNRRYKFLMAHGQTGLSVAFDYPTLYGYDSDHLRAKGEVGRCGVAIASLEDMETLFDGIDQSKVSTSMTINPPANALLAMYIVAAEKKGVPSDVLTGTIQNDMFKEYQAQKTWISPPEPSLRLIVDTVKYCAEHVPKWNTISISGYHIREAGSTAVQELAFTLANGMAYAQACIDAGMDVDAFAPRFSFFFNSHIDFFEEIAKFRAARRIWARKMRDKFKAENQRSWLMRFHCQTAGCSLTSQQPYNNIIRSTTEALAAVIGGCQSLHVNSMDEVLSLPTAKAAEVSLRTQQIVAHETGAPNTIDPLAGSYFVEALTNQMEAQAEEYFDKIEKLGGVLRGIEVGFFQQEIARAAFDYQIAIERRERIQVGVNEYITDEELPIEILRIDPAIEAEQESRLKSLRARRDNAAVKRALDELRDACKSNANTMYPILDAVRSYATLGEVCDIFREVYGEYQDPALF